ncbi:MAG: hypothetical protein KDI19_03625, partial [Pseudomonadales bacterium]|nr:hypothetical protein [Pseudomonadales bacterium]
HLEAEYEKLIHSLNEWAQCRQEWFELKKATVLKRFDATELRAKLKSLEAQLDLQRRQWRMLTAQFA